jgi:MYXO-CTERM domain-containing protein
MKKTLLALALITPAQAAVLLDDHFDDGSPTSNAGAGYTIFQSAGWNPAESGTAVAWTGASGWGWGGSELHSNTDYAAPVPGSSYRVTWDILPMTVTTASDQGWGDIRMQLALVPATLAQGSSSAEVWPMTSGVISADIAFKSAPMAPVTFHTKHSGEATSTDGSYHPVTGNMFDPTVPNQITIELTDVDATVFLNGNPIGTQTLASMNLGVTGGEEFASGFFPSMRGAVVSTGQGSMGVDRMVVEYFAPVPEPSTALVGAMGLGLLAGRRRRSS